MIGSTGSATCMGVMVDWRSLFSEIQEVFNFPISRLLTTKVQQYTLSAGKYHFKVHVKKIKFM